MIWRWQVRGYLEPFILTIRQAHTYNADAVSSRASDDQNGCETSRYGHPQVFFTTYVFFSSLVLVHDREAAEDGISVPPPPVSSEPQVAPQPFLHPLLPAAPSFPRFTWSLQRLLLNFNFPHPYTTPRVLYPNLKVLLSWTFPTPPMFLLEPTAQTMPILCHTLFRQTQAQPLRSRTPLLPRITKHATCSLPTDPSFPGLHLWMSSTSISTFLRLGWSLRMTENFPSFSRHDR